MVPYVGSLALCAWLEAMTLENIDPAGFAAAEARLAVGEPIVIPTPSPLPYVLFGDDSRSINAAKGRPLDQPVGITPTSADAIRGHLAVTADTERLVEWLIFNAHLSVLAPADASVPDWLAPAVVDGLAALAGAWFSELGPLLDGREYAYSSSANVTAAPPATDAVSADRTFDGRLVVLDGDRLRTRGIRHGSTTMLAVPADGDRNLGGVGPEPGAEHRRPTSICRWAAAVSLGISLSGRGQSTSAPGRAAPGTSLGR